VSKYLIYFNQQWVGDHTSEWFASRGPLARAVLAEMKEQGVLIFGGGLYEDLDLAFGSDENGNVGGAITTDGEYIGGMTIIEVETDDEAKMWGSRVAQACGWPQEIRKFKPF
jgi:hypothetical protein